MRTIENRAEDNSSKIGLLLKILFVCDLRSVRIVGPGLELSARHDPDEGREGFGRAWDRRWGGGVSEVKNRARRERRGDGLNKLRES